MSQLLRTALTMSPVVPVILFWVTLDTKKMYFICLNDYVEHILLPYDPTYAKNRKKTIYIPIANEITTASETIQPLFLYSKRAKLASTFLTINLQHEKIQYLLLENDYKELFDQTLQFITILKSRDIWYLGEFWQILKSDYDKLIKTEKMILEYSEKPDNNIEFIANHIQMVWQVLNSLSSIYEEIFRRWKLPTYFAQLTSY